ncbi:asparagine synthase (glutamine-hydrolyzing) [Clostridium saudiense]|uniref:asparagine synthase (glutamine-hydrolyzing) n=1 Tax=Clostridium saudiense TaxID=1414720 RepID=UPI000822B23B|nr:asparagine synthase (glutamine-hydrolyzing) [Clostridium saudiense]MDU7454644.1 asparagine synthase (glutamine-hydrolyzing) [Clostridium saudiense]SCJ53416.1 Asparagine synthetase [glutamine-hydrolyzing] 1 [uncultured Clostridium sp.]
MCGHISIYYKNKKADELLIRQLTEKITHRGPDDTGYFIKDNIAFGFNRLSIIDLEHGNQPFEKENRTIIFNGEIYNHQELRKRLEFSNKFTTNSDTEVLLTSYINYGEKCVDKLRGMFSFIIYDEVKEIVFGARDHFGIKPLYYINNNEFIAFSSEYKVLVKVLKEISINETALQNYFSFQYTPNYNTIINEIKEVPNGTYFTIKNGNLEFYRYHDIKFNNKNITKDNIYDIVNDSVKHHMISNVEVGTFLSGGIDSTIVTALAAKLNPKIKTFSIGFDVEGYNELTVAKKTAEYLGVENISVNVSEQDYIKALPKVAYYMDDPLADPSCVGIYLLSEEARKHVKVVLSGEGSDELFGGYNIYKEYYSLKPFSYLPESIKREVNKVAKVLPDIKGKSYLLRGTTKLKDRYIGNAKIFNNEEVKKVIVDYDENNTYSDILAHLYEECDKNSYDSVTTMQYIDINTWLEGDILLKADKMSMAHSLEVRVPFLDKEVLNCATGLTLSQKISKNNTKVLLREAFKDIVPPYMKEKKKLGFPTPIRVWLKSDLGIYAREIITNAAVDKLINKEYVLELLDEHIQGKKDNSRKVWTVFMFCLWYQIYIEGKVIEELEVNNKANKQDNKCKLA